MRHRVHRRRSGDGQRQLQQQVRIVDHRLRQDLWARLRQLHAALGLAEDRRHLRAGERRRDDDLRQIGAQRDRLRQPDRRAAADRQNAVRLHRRHRRQRRLRDIGRRMHLRPGIDDPRPLADHPREGRGDIGLRRRRDHHGARNAQPIQLGADRGAGAGPEDDAAGVGGVGEVHRYPPGPIAAPPSPLVGEGGSASRAQRGTRR